MTDLDRELVGRLRRDLSAAEFSVDAVTALWGEDAAAALNRGHRVPAKRALDALARSGAHSARADLAELFILGLPIAVERAENACPSLGIHGALELDLLRVDGDSAYPCVDLRPYAFIDAAGPGAWWIASDLGEVATRGALAVDHVLGIGGASNTLSALMIGDRVESALDLGTGCGIQALHASRHANRVVATDISERALDFARLNAALNGVTNIEFRHGSLFEPVASERFDHIVSNPPFVITPRVQGVPEYEYRDGGLVGDALVAAVVRELPAHLKAGGVAQLLGNWEYHGDITGLERVADWLTDGETAPVDAWIVEREVQDPALYAETWIRDGGTRPGTTDYDSLYDAWLADFASRGVTAVGFGYLALRRPHEERPTVHVLERIDTHGTNEAGLGAYVSGVLRAQEWLAVHDDDALAATALIAAPDVTEERHYWPGNEDPTVLVMHQGAGFGRMERVDTAAAAFVGACDGDLSVGAIIAAIAQLLEVDSAALSAELLPTARDLVMMGMLAPASFRSTASAARPRGF